MKVLELLDELEDLVENASSMPLTNKVLVSNAEMNEILQDIRVMMPDEVKQAKWIKDERTKILYDAEEEAGRITKAAEQKAEQIVKDAMKRAEQLVAKDEITKSAEAKGQQIVSTAKSQADQIRQGAYHYAEEIMNKLSANIVKINDSIEKNKSELTTYQAKSQES